MRKCVNKTRNRLQERLGLSRSQVNRLIKSGETSEDFLEARRRKEIALADLSEHKAEKSRIETETLRQSLIPSHDVARQAKEAAAIFSDELNATLNNAPGKLAGLDEIGIRLTLDQEFALLLKNIRARFQALA